MNGIRMMGDRILVKPIKVNEARTKLVMPEGNGAGIFPRAPMFGEVVAAGPGTFNHETKQHDHMPVGVGDKVMFRNHLKDEVVVIGEEIFLRMGACDVEGVIEDLSQGFNQVASHAMMEKFSVTTGFQVGLR